MKTMLNVVMCGALATGLWAQEEPVAEDEVAEEVAGVVAEAVVDEAVAQRGGKAVAGTISEVTLYRGTALVTREIVLAEGPAGPLEVLVSLLPTATDPATVYADTAEGVEIRSVTCRTRPADQAEERQGEVVRLEGAILEAEQKISHSQNEIALRRIRQEFLRSLGDFVAPTVSQEMAHGVLQADELEKVTQMHFKEYETASQEILELGFEIDADQKSLAALRTERDKLAAGPPVTYDVVIYLERSEAGPARLKLNYLVKDCGWLPVYNVRGNTAEGTIDLEFNALIHQVSGEDWKGARLALSTASPTVSAYNPHLAPLHVSVTAGAKQQAEVGNAARYNQALVDRSKAVKGQLQGKSIAEMADANYAANESAASVQLIELSERMSELRLMSEEGADEDLSIQYALPKPVNLVSRRDGQMVPVLQHRGKAEFYHVTVPILTSSVFREAQITNLTERDLLGGQVNVYLDGEFTGRTDMPTIARGLNFTLGFGVDGQLRALRSLVDRRETVQGGNRQVEISVEVVVDNYKDKPVKLLVRERTPFMEDTASLRVALGAMSTPLSNDADYQRFEKPKGILLWDLPVAAGVGEKATSLRYAYSLEFDKSLTLQDISGEQKTRLRTEFLRDRKSGK